MELQELTDKLNSWINSFIEMIKNLPQTIIDSSWDEQIAWGAIGVGIIILIIVPFVW